jgi:hypothetical protein
MPRIPFWFPQMWSERSKCSTRQPRCIRWKASTDCRVSPVCEQRCAAPLTLCSPSWMLTVTGRGLRTRSTMHCYHHPSSSSGPPRTLVRSLIKLFFILPQLLFIVVQLLFILLHRLFVLLHRHSAYYSAVIHPSSAVIHPSSAVIHRLFIVS